MVKVPLGKLSGGERARIALLELLLGENNMLLLDEPTNHLDTDAKEALEETLQDYEGAIITVSHDRYFLDKICDTIWELPGDGVYGYGRAITQTISKERASNKQNPAVSFRLIFPYLLYSITAYTK